MFTTSSIIFEIFLLNIGYWIFRKSHFEYLIEKERGKLKDKQSYISWEILYPVSEHDLTEEQKKTSKLHFQNPFPNLSEKPDDSPVTKRLIERYNKANQYLIISIVAMFIIMFVVNYIIIG